MFNVSVRETVEGWMPMLKQGPEEMGRGDINSPHRLAPAGVMCREVGVGRQVRGPCEMGEDVVLDEELEHPADLQGVRAPAHAAAAAPMGHWGGMCCYRPPPPMARCDGGRRTGVCVPSGVRRPW